MSTVCKKLHTIAQTLPWFSFSSPLTGIPNNGIYLLFEKGEYGHGGERIVRVGTHTGENQLRSRIQQHFTQENKDRSIFRKNIGRALLHKSSDPYLAVWEIDFTTKASRDVNGHLLNSIYQNQIEQQVSEYIRNFFSFVVLHIDSKQQRLEIESKLISTLSTCDECFPSATWLGNYSPKEKIRNSGLWLVNELNKQPLTEAELTTIFADL